MAPEPQITALSTTTTAYVQPPGGWFLNNAGWVIGSERTLLVDTCATEARTRRLLTAMQAAGGSSGGELVACLTHAHGDHANGAGQVTRAGGTVLASEPAAQQIATGPHTVPEAFDYSGWGDITPPDSMDVISGQVRVDLGDVDVDVVRVPAQAHTDGDVVAFVERDGVLFTGDLVFAGVTPLLLHGSVSGWLDVLSWLTEFDAARLVPGHGAILTPQSTVVTALGDYLQWLIDATGTDTDPRFGQLEQQARQRWSDWLDPERHAANLRIAHAETHGHPRDLEAALSAMLSAAGGRITLDI